MDSRRNALNEIVDGIVNTREILAYALVRRDGIMITDGLANSADPKLIAAMTVAISGTAELATELLRQGRFLRTIVECERGTILITDAGRHALLLSLVYADTNLGLLLMQLEKVGRRIESVLDHDGMQEDAVMAGENGTSRQG